MIALILLGVVLAYREIEHYINKINLVTGKTIWDENHYWVKFFEFDQDKWFKVFDSWHSSIGLIVLIVVAGYEITLIDNLFMVDFGYWWLNIILWWSIVFYIRNIFMHIIFKKKAYREWSFLVPFNLLKPIMKG